MDTKPPLLWTPEIAIRSKQQVLQEDWGVLTRDAVFAKILECDEAPEPPVKEWTTLKPRDITLFYQTRSAPPIPSLEEILGTTAENCLHSKISLHRVCKLGDAVIKCASNPNVLEEAENLLFLAEKRPNLRIPTVLAVWSFVLEPGLVAYCFMMNFIEGGNMTFEKFAELPIHAQDTICTKISSQLRYLRELPSEPEGYYGRVHGQGWLCAPHGLDSSTSASPYRGIVGPYKTYEEYCAAMYRAQQTLRAGHSSGEEWGPEEPEIVPQLESVFQGWGDNEPKFTWIDPKIQNIIARKIIKEDDGSEDWEVFLIDWEYCGWYPAWTQVLQVMTICGVVLRDPDNPVGLISYRGSEITPMILKDFDPKPEEERKKDEERLKLLSDLCWHFF